MLYELCELNFFARFSSFSRKFWKIKMMRRKISFGLSVCRCVVFSNTKRILLPFLSVIHFPYLIWFIGIFFVRSDLINFDTKILTCRNLFFLSLQWLTFIYTTIYFCLCSAKYWHNQSFLQHLFNVLFFLCFIIKLLLYKLSW